MPKRAKKIPRYVLGLTDTHLVVPGPKGDQYFNINAAFDDFEELYKEIPEEDGGSELGRVVRHFRQASEELERALEKK